MWTFVLVFKMGSLDMCRQTQKCPCRRLATSSVKVTAMCGTKTCKQRWTFSFTCSVDTCCTECRALVLFCWPCFQRRPSRGQQTTWKEESQPLSVTRASHLESEFSIYTHHWTPSASEDLLQAPQWLSVPASPSGLFHCDKQYKTKTWTESHIWTESFPWKSLLLLRTVFFLRHLYWLWYCTPTSPGQRV